MENKMSECKFKVGETYKTRDNREAKVVAVVPEANVANRVAALIDGEIIVYCENGQYYEYGPINPFDLIPNKRIAWVNLYPMGKSTNAQWHETQGAADECAGADRIGNRAYPVEIEE
jgi:hypothetical protein